MKRLIDVLLIFAIICIPYVTAFGFNHWISYYNDVLTWNNAVNGVWKHILYFAVIIAIMIIFLIHSELSLRIAKKVNYGLITIILLYCIYLVIYVISLLCTSNNIVVNFMRLLYQNSSFLYMFVLSLMYSIYNIKKFLK